MADGKRAVAGWVVLPASAGLVLAFSVAIWWLVGDQSTVPASAQPDFAFRPLDVSRGVERAAGLASTLLAAVMSVMLVWFTDQGTATRVGVDTFIDLTNQSVEDVGHVDVVLDVIGGEVRDRSTALLRPGGTLVTIVGPPQIQPVDGRAIFFVVEPDRAQLTELANRQRNGRIAPIVSAEHPLQETITAFGPDAPRLSGKTIVRAAGETITRQSLAEVACRRG